MEKQTLIIEMIIVAIICIPAIIFCDTYLVSHYKNDKDWDGVRILLSISAIVVSLFFMIFEVIWCCKVLNLPV